MSRAGARRRHAAVGTRALGALAVGVMVLAGCQSNPEPPPLESASGSPSPSATESPTPAAPTLPAEAKGTSEAAAKAFVRHWIEVLNYAMATGDTAPLSALSDPDCSSCAAVVERIESVYESDGSIVSNGWHVRSIQAVPMQPRARPKFDLGLSMSRQRVKEDGSAKPRFFKGGRLPATFSLGRHDKSWLVLNWERAA